MAEFRLAMESSAAAEAEHDDGDDHNNDERNKNNDNDDDVNNDDVDAEKYENIEKDHRHQMVSGKTEVAGKSVSRYLRRDDGGLGIKKCNESNYIRLPAFPGNSYRCSGGPYAGILHFYSSNRGSPIKFKANTKQPSAPPSGPVEYKTTPPDLNDQTRIEAVKAKASWAIIIAILEQYTCCGCICNWCALCCAWGVLDECQWDLERADKKSKMVSAFVVIGTMITFITIFFCFLLGMAPCEWSFV